MEREPTNRHERSLFLLLLLTVFVYRISLIDRGAYAFWDESRYKTALKATAKLLDGDWSSFTRKIMSTDGRPGDTLLRLPATLPQLYLKRHYKLPTKSHPSTLIPQAQNVLFSVLLVAVFYFLARELLPKDQPHPLPLFATFVYAFLANNQLYVRHILPYEGALLLHLLAALIVVRTRKEAHLLLSGLLCGISLLAYPGYYAWPLLVCFLAIRNSHLNTAGESQSRWVGYLGKILAGCLIPIATMEAVTRLTGLSYLQSEQQLSTLIIQGEYAEGFSFIWDYLRSVEGAIGLLLLAGVGLFLFQLGARALRENGFRSFNALDAFVVGTIAIWFFHATATFAFHRFVFYGRLIHQYYPGLVLAWFAVIAALNSNRIKQMILLSTIVTSGTCFYSFASDYYDVAYPRDVLYSLKIDSRLVPAPQKLAESPPQMNYYSPKPTDLETRAPYSKLSDYILVNFAFFSPVRDEPYVPFNPRFISALGSREIFTHDHFLSFPPYTFEGYWQIARDNLRSRRYPLRVFRLPENIPSALERFTSYQWDKPRVEIAGSERRHKGACKNKQEDTDSGGQSEIVKGED